MSALISCATVKSPRATVNDRQCGGTRLAAAGPVEQLDDGLGQRGRDGQFGVPVGVVDPADGGPRPDRGDTGPGHLPHLGRQQVGGGRENPKQLICEGESTDARQGDRPPRSSGDAR
jgi:hypothetical protein